MHIHQSRDLESVRWPGRRKDGTCVRPWSCVSTRPAPDRGGKQQQTAKSAGLCCAMMISLHDASKLTRLSQLRGHGRTTLMISRGMVLHLPTGQRCSSDQRTPCLLLLAAGGDLEATHGVMAARRSAIGRKS